MIWGILAQIISLLIFGWWGLLFTPIIVLFAVVVVLGVESRKSTPNEQHIQNNYSEIKYKAINNIESERAARAAIAKAERESKARERAEAKAEQEYKARERAENAAIAKEERESKAREKAKNAREKARIANAKARERAENAIEKARIAEEKRKIRNGHNMGNL